MDKVAESHNVCWKRKHAPTQTTIYAYSLWCCVFVVHKRVFFRITPIAGAHAAILMRTSCDNITDRCAIVIGCRHSSPSKMNTLNQCTLYFIYIYACKHARESEQENVREREKTRLEGPLYLLIIHT